MIRLLRLAWDRLSIYLPIMLMGILALGTYWLLRSSPGVQTVEQPVPASPDPDYVLERFSIQTFDSGGQLKSDVAGAQARHFPYTDMLEIDQASIRSFNARGQLITATANRAIANNDATEVQLIGDAKVVREAGKAPDGTPLPRISYSGEFLHAFLEQERIKSHKPVTLMRGEDRITADSMELSNLDQIVEFRGRVRGVLQPPPGP